MKKRIILLSSTLLLSFFMFTSAVAQETVSEDPKAKTEVTEKGVPAKCGGCPSVATCKGAAAEKENKDAQKVTDAKKQKSVATNDKKKKK